MTNLEKIRKACVEANLSILDLKFGCKTEKVTIFSVFESEGREKYSTSHHSAQWPESFGGDLYSKERLGKILGREIQLADVLLATKFGWQEAINLGSTISMKITHTFSPFGT